MQTQREHVNSVTQHSPLCTNCFRWEPLYTFYHLILYLYLLCRSYGAKHPEIYKTSSTSSLHWCGAWGDTFGGKLALRAALAGGRRQLMSGATSISCLKTLQIILLRFDIFIGNIYPALGMIRDGTSSKSWTEYLLQSSGGVYLSTWKSSSSQFKCSIN